MELNKGGGGPVLMFLLITVCCLQPSDPSCPVSLVQGKMATFEPSQRQSVSGVVPWSPPQVNWNPWTSCNIDEGPLAFVGPSAVLSLHGGSLFSCLWSCCPLQQTLLRLRPLS